MLWYWWPDQVQGNTALHTAAKSRSVAAVEALLKGGVDPNARDEQVAVCNVLMT